MSVLRPGCEIQTHLNWKSMLGQLFGFSGDPPAPILQAQNIGFGYDMGGGGMLAFEPHVVSDMNIDISAAINSDPFGATPNRTKAYRIVAVHVDFTLALAPVAQQCAIQLLDVTGANTVLARLRPPNQGDEYYMTPYGGTVGDGTNADVRLAPVFPIPLIGAGFNLRFRFAGGAAGDLASVRVHYYEVEAGLELPT